MKLLFICIAGIYSLPVLAQNSSVYQSINDDGKNLTIKIKGMVNGKAVDYNRTFNITGLGKAAQDDLKRRVYDTVGIPEPVPPAQPIAPAPPAAPKLSIAPVPPVEPNSPVITSKSEDAEIFAIGGDHPFTKEIKYNPKTGLLFMKYRFQKNGEEVTLEKSVDAKDKSKEERDQIIKKYEKEIGVLQPKMI